MDECQQASYNQINVSREGSKREKRKQQGKMATVAVYNERQARMPIEPTHHKFTHLDGIIGGGNEGEGSSRSGDSHPDRSNEGICRLTQFLYGNVYQGLEGSLAFCGRQCRAETPKRRNIVNILPNNNQGVKEIMVC